MAVKDMSGFRQLLAFDVSIETEAKKVLLYFQTASLFLLKTTVYVVPGALPSVVRQKVPKQVHLLECPVDNSASTTELLNEIDLVIGPLNELTREAIQRELPVWLCHDDETDLDTDHLKKYFPTVTSFRIKDPISSVFKAMSTLLLLERDMLVFTPGLLSTLAINLPDFRLDIPDLFLDSPLNILELFDAPMNSLCSVSIETTTYCNLRCSYCPNATVGRPTKLMEENTFFRIIDSLAEYLPGFSGKITPHFYGEPLTDNRLERFVEYTRDKLPAATVIIYTNGILLTKDRYISLTNSGVAQFVVSQHTEAPDKN